ncbi:Fur family transcriptional regulator [Sinanaerobacter chloroacetimidivorans]|jgi:Fur family peroxide stress response transcriptional regulator|uniref:Transcriptional repressor n=1 Tax=Sinanaerobacter chloroacetimidivorans TaxID=2818044 RepID=A0A8J7VZ24_9FIRM|nr:Fur family transcriptional regulator [Sinanaerobacter chloroacetimidivorans]MBR0597349.1 transcriptional repressor [Sinanaerobacter chloroacetimidivorans]
MKPTFENLADILKEKNIRLSHQRLKVLEYLIHNRCHPTVHQIYTDLHKDIPTLSKTTIYSTLNALAEADLVRVITIEDNETRYDIATDDHGHFKCESCGNIYDFDIEAESITGDLKNFKIKDKSVYFKGICPKCQETLS